MEISEGYVECVEAMAAAARQWFREHPFAGPLQFTDFEERMARQAGRPPDERGGIVAILSDVIDLWAANADTGFTNVDGQSNAPGARAWMVCSCCATIQRVNASADGFEPVSVRVINAQPKSLRKKLYAMKAAIEKTAEKAKTKKSRVN